MGRGIEEQRKAAYWARRAAAVENDTSISKWDPAALPLLAAKMADLEAKRDEQQASNAADRKSTAPASVMARMGELKRNCPWIRQPFDLTHLGANVRRYKQRVGGVEPFQPANGIAASEASEEE